jgi:formate-dependent nitrite reductase membrane component NrfD
MQITKINIPLLFIEAVALVAMLVLGERGQHAKSLHSLLQGQLAEPFWVGLVLCGLLLPLIIETVSLTCAFCRKRRLLPYAYLATACCTLIGGFCLRLVLISAGLPAFDPAIATMGA